MVASSNLRININWLKYFLINIEKKNPFKEIKFPFKEIYKIEFLI
jgi:hypothetical protein